MWHASGYALGLAGCCGGGRHGGRDRGRRCPGDGRQRGRNGSPTGGVAPVLAKSTSATGLDLHGGVRIVFSCKSTACAHHESATVRLTAANEAFFAKLFAGWTAYAPLGAGSPCARSTDPGWPCEFEYPNASLNHIGVAYGIVAWSHGAPHASIYRRQTWVRRWHRDTAACFASFMPVHVDGALWSNFPCAAWQLIHQSDGVGLTDGEDAADWPWLNLDPCHTASASRPARTRSATATATAPSRPSPARRALPCRSPRSPRARRAPARSSSSRPRGSSSTRPDASPERGGGGDQRAGAPSRAGIVGSRGGREDQRDRGGARAWCGARGAVRQSRGRGREDARLSRLRVVGPTAGETRCFVYTRWQSEEHYRAWVESPAFTRGHAQAAAGAGGPETGQSFPSSSRSRCTDRATRLTTGAGRSRSRGTRHTARRRSVGPCRRCLNRSQGVPGDADTECNGGCLRPLRFAG